MKDEEQSKITNTEVEINPFKDLNPTVDIKNVVNNVNWGKKVKTRKI